MSLALEWLYRVGVFSLGSHVKNFLLWIWDMQDEAARMAQWRPLIGWIFVVEMMRPGCAFSRRSLPCFDLLEAGEADKGPGMSASPC